MEYNMNNNINMNQQQYLTDGKPTTITNTTNNPIRSALDPARSAMAVPLLSVAVNAIRAANNSNNSRSMIEIATKKAHDQLEQIRKQERQLGQQQQAGSSSSASANINRLSCDEIKTIIYKILEEEYVETFKSTGKDDNNNELKRLYIKNGNCHLCHSRKENTFNFHCGLSSHMHCVRHIDKRLNYKINMSDLCKKVTTTALQCPVCTLKCTCTKCVKVLNSLVASVKSTAHTDDSRIYADDTEWIYDVISKSANYPRSLTVRRKKRPRDAAFTVTNAAVDQQYLNTQVPFSFNQPIKKINANTTSSATTNTSNNPNNNDTTLSSINTNNNSMRNAITRACNDKSSTNLPLKVFDNIHNKVAMSTQADLAVIEAQSSDQEQQQHKSHYDALVDKKNVPRNIKEVLLTSIIEYNNNSSDPKIAQQRKQSVAGFQDNMQSGNLHNLSIDNETKKQKTKSSPKPTTSPSFSDWSPSPPSANKMKSLSSAKKPVNVIDLTQSSDRQKSHAQQQTMHISKSSLPSNDDKSKNDIKNNNNSRSNNISTNNNNNNNNNNNKPPKKLKENQIKQIIISCLQKQCKAQNKKKMHNPAIEQNCHICHVRRPKGMFFNCGKIQHSYCLKHIEERLGIKTKHLESSSPSSITKEMKNLIPNNLCCPICTLTCTCARCKRTLSNLTTYVKNKYSKIDSHGIITKSKKEMDNWINQIIIQSPDYPKTLCNGTKSCDYKSSGNSSSSKAKKISTTDSLSSSSSSSSICKRVTPSSPQKDPMVMNNNNVMQQKQPSSKNNKQVKSSNNNDCFKVDKSKCIKFENDFFYYLSNIKLPSLSYLSTYICLGVDGERGRRFYEFLSSTLGSSESVFICTLCFYGIFNKINNLLPSSTPSTSSSNSNATKDKGISNNNHNSNTAATTAGLKQMYIDYFDNAGACLCTSSHSNIAADRLEIRNFFKDVKRAASDTFTLDPQTPAPTSEIMDKTMNDFISIISYYEYHFFNDLANYGTDCIVILASSATYADGSYIRRFYGLLKGERSETKYSIMNQCLCAVLLRWIKYDINNDSNGQDQSCMNFSTFWEICLMLSSYFMSYGIQYSIVRDFFDDTSPTSFGTLVQETYQRYHQDGFIKSTSVPYKYSILEHNKKQSNLGLNDAFIKRHKHQIHQKTSFNHFSSNATIPSLVIPLHSNNTDNKNDEVLHMNTNLRCTNQELTSKVNMLENENAKMKESVSSLQSQLSSLKQKLNTTATSSTSLINKRLQRVDEI